MLFCILAIPFLLFTFLLTGVSPGVQVLKPMMPAGCDATCRNMSWCWICRYIAVDLSCHVHRRPPKREGKRKMVLSGRAPGNNCQYKNMTSHCEEHKLKAEIAKEHDTTQANTGNLSRILMVPRGRRIQAKVFNIRNTSIEDYPHLAHKFVTGLAYISRLGKLFVTMHYPYEQALTNVDFKNVEIIGNFELKSESLAADNTRMIIFIKHKYHRKHISRFDIKEKTLRKLILLEKSAGNLAIDSGTQHIFVSYLSKGIVKYSYTGQFVSKVLKQMVGISFYYASATNTLVFICERNLSVCIIDLRNGKTLYNEYVGFDFKILTIQKDVIFVNQCSRGMKGRIRILPRNGPKINRKTNMECSIVFCEIP